MIARLRQGPSGLMLVEDDGEAILRAQREMAALEGPIVRVVVAPDRDKVPLERLVLECSVSVNLAAAGGDAGLMTLAG